MLYNIKNVILFILILFFMYIILLRETIIEGGFKKAVKKTSDKAENVVDKAENVVDKAENVVDNASEKVANVSTQVVEDVGGLATRILDEAFDGLIIGVDKIYAIFDSAEKALTNVSNKSSNFKADVANSMNNQEFSSTQAQSEQARAKEEQALVKEKQALDMSMKS